jgi:photosystem II stability/assembly factor-like uncharacterized protein
MKRFLLISVILAAMLLNACVNPITITATTPATPSVSAPSTSSPSLTQTQTSTQKPQVDSWSWVNPLPQGNLLTSVSFVDSVNGWAVGNAGTILRTKDGGQTWMPIDTGLYGDFTAVHFLDGVRGVATGTYGGTPIMEGFLLLTIDGGITWTQKASANDFLNGISFVDSQYGWAVGGSGGHQGLLLSTTDGGVTWSSTTIPMSGYAVAFADRMHGWIAGYTDLSDSSVAHIVIATSDGGITWTTAWTGSDLLHSLTLVDAHHVRAVGNGVVVGTDDGTSWSVFVKGGTNNLRGAVFSDAMTGWAVGASIYAEGRVFSGRQGVIVHSVDGGHTWTKQPYQNIGEAVSIALIDADHLVAVGLAGEIMFTGNGGKTWSRATRGMNTDWFTVKFCSANDGWAAATGVFLATHDGGQTWQDLTTSLGQQIEYITDFTFTDKEHLWLLTSAQDGTGGILHYSADGGVSWNHVPIDQRSISRVTFIDEKHGWIVGGTLDEGGFVLHTVDGGASWAVSNPSGQPLYRVSFIDPAVGWAVGYGGTLLKTTDGGATWAIQTSGVQGNISAVLFRDSNNGWAGGEDGILLTTDGGEHWIVVPKPESGGQIRDIAFVDNLVGWAVGELSMGASLAVPGFGEAPIWKTTDGGLTWIVERSGLGGILSNISVVDVRHVWLSGGGGAILFIHTADATLGITAMQPPLPASTTQPITTTTKPITTLGPITIAWNTFLGGRSTDSSEAIAVDSIGNIYISGRTYDATWGDPVRAFTPFYNNDVGHSENDAFVAKLDNKGNLIWNTFLGGNGGDYGHEIAADDSGNVYVSGFSDATWGEPVRAFTSSYDDDLHSSLRDAFVAKLDNSGNLLWNTFMGGSGEDSDQGIAVDSSGNVFIGGSSDITWSTPVRLFESNSDTFVAKLDSNGSLQWNTFLGGSGSDFGGSIELDFGGNIYLSGYSTDNWGSPVRSYSGDYDVFAAKLNNSGDLQWNTFLGGERYDQGGSIAVDDGGNVHVTGRSADNWGSPVRSYSGHYDVFAAKLNNNGDLQWNTFLGGSGGDYSGKVALDYVGNVYVCGRSASTWGTESPFYKGSYNSFAAKLDSNGTFQWNTFLIPSDFVGDAGFSGLAVDSSGDIYISGSSDATWGSPVRDYAMDDDAFIVKLHQ